MQALQYSYRGLSLMVQLNRDRLAYLVTLALALMAGAYLGSL